MAARKRKAVMAGERGMGIMAVKKRKTVKQ